jgi:hypothetical protein
MKKYLVGVREVDIVLYMVEARSPEEAKTKVRDRQDCEIVGEPEYSHELDEEFWSVEETIERILF